MNTSINSAYGALANSFFLWFDPSIAEAITLSGQLSVKTGERVANDLLNRALKTQVIDYTIGIDTDSVGGDSIIEINGKKTSIADFYNKANGQITERGIIDNHLKYLTDDYSTPSISKHKKLENKKVRYVSKHKVKKTMYRVKVGNDVVTMTNDHSIIALNTQTNEIEEVKPGDLKKGVHLLIRNT